MKDAVYFNGWYRGVNHMDIPLGREFSEGYYLKPRLQFQLMDAGNPFDPKTGEKKGEYKAVEDVYEHYIFLSEDKKERRKQLEDILEKYPDTLPEELNLQFRQANPKNNHQSQHGGNFSWDSFCDLSIKELGEAQEKGYFADSNGITRDKDQTRVKWNRSTGKMDAVK